MSKKTTATADKNDAAQVSPAAQAPVNAKLTKDERIELYRKMVRIRRF